MGKRMFDIVLASLGLILAAPVIAAVTLALWIEHRGPIFYHSPRIGRGGNVFSLTRFRTMVEAPPGVGPEVRLTAVGRFIRTYSVDDLPSLFHVLRGDLSLVGPRPMEPDRLKVADRAWQRILAVRPGYVSYAILTLARDYNTSDMAERQRLELEYVRRHSLRFDLRLLARALAALVRSRGNIKLRGTSR